MLHSIGLFAAYLVTGLILLNVFIFTYVKFTPYNEFKLIREQNNEAAAISLSGATIGFAIPLVACAFYTVSLPEMCLWAVIIGFIQLLLFTVMRYSAEIEKGNRAPAIFLATLSISIGLLSAVSISH